MNLRLRAIYARVLLLIGSLIVLTSCTDIAPRGGGDILVIGDSVMAWNRSNGQSIADVIEAGLGRDVTDKSVAGAKFDNGSVIASAVGFDVQAQYPAGRWNWVVVNGGANDMGSDDCGCGDCRAVVSTLIAEDGQSGKIAAFLARVRSDGAQVVWMGYYNAPGTSFAGCTDDLASLEGRIKRNLVAQGGYFLEGEDFVAKNDPTNFDEDDTHPSPKGSAILGTALADIIARAQSRSQSD